MVFNKLEHFEYFYKQAVMYTRQKSRGRGRGRGRNVEARPRRGRGKKFRGKARPRTRQQIRGRGKAAKYKTVISLLLRVGTKCADRLERGGGGGWGEDCGG